MKKSLIAAAVAAVIVAPAANAGVVVYGKIHASIDYLSYEQTGYRLEQPPTGGEPHLVPYSYTDSAWYVANRASRIGFKGTEDLGNGLSLIWKAETTYNLSEGGDGWGSGRNAYIGLAGDWGTFLYGRHDTPMKISTGRLDLFSDQLGDYNYDPNPQNALFGPGFHDVRAPNAIAYISPNWNGFTIAGAIVPGENDGSSAGDGLADGYSIAAMYSNNGLYLAAAYEDIDDLGLIPHEKWRIGAGYTINAFTVNAVYENQESSWSGVNEDNDVWQISGAYDFGNNRLKVAYGENKGDYNCGMYCGYDSKRKSWAIGLDHNLSKRTKAYIVYAQADNSVDYDHPPIDELPNDLVRVRVSSLSFEDPNMDVSGFSMGLMHSF